MSEGLRDISIIYCPHCGEETPAVERCLHCNIDFRVAGIDQTGDFNSAASGFFEVRPDGNDDPGAEPDAELLAELGELHPGELTADELGTSLSDVPDDIGVALGETTGKKGEKLSHDDVFKRVFAKELMTPGHDAAPGPRRARIAVVVSLVLVGALLLGLFFLLLPEDPLARTGNSPPPLGDLPGFDYVPER